jgi:hypothetical protein
MSMRNGRSRGLLKLKKHSESFLLAGCFIQTYDDKKADIETVHRSDLLVVLKNVPWYAYWKVVSIP